MFSNDIYDFSQDLPPQKKFAIWGINPKSYKILTQMINSRKNVEYFVDVIGDYRGEEIFGKEIIIRQALKKRDDIFTIIDRVQYLEYEEWIKDNLEDRVYILEIGSVSKRIKEKGLVYIYGAGNCGKKTLQILKKQNVDVQGFIDSDIQKVGKVWCDYPIYGRKVLNRNDIVIISSIYFNDIWEDLRLEFDERNIYIDYRNTLGGEKLICYDASNIWIKPNNGRIYELDYKVFYPTVWNDFRNKKIILYGNNEISVQIIEILDLIGVKVCYIVDDYESIVVVREKQYEVKKIDILAKEKINDILVLVVKYNMENGFVIDSGERLERFGLKYFRNYRWITSISHACKKNVWDELLGYIGIYEKKDLRYPGFYFYNKNMGSNKRIVILGNSCSNPPIYDNLVKSWVEYFADKCKDIEVISAAMSANFSGQELLKLIRDVGVLHPDMCISYSGVSDIGMMRIEKHPFHREKGRKDDICYGIENEISKSDFWILMQRYMRAICEVNGCEYIGILQPALVLKSNEDLSNHERRLVTFYEDAYTKEYPDFVNDIRYKMKNYKWMHDFSNVFEKVKETVYRDNCHLNDRGNQIIADRVYQIIKEKLDGLLYK